MEANTEAYPERTKANQGEMKTSGEETEICLKKRQTMPEAVEVVADSQEVLNEETAVEII
jgi:hypothetical protein